MTIYTYTVSSIFIVWFIITILVQFKDTELTTWIKSYDALSLLPLWTFFAPNPGVNDYHLLYREENEKGERSNWKEIEINENRTFSTCLWNPNKRSKKVLSDVIQNVVSMINEYKEKPHAIMVSLPYILILNAIMKEQKLHLDTQKKQFLLSASHGYESSKAPQLVLISEFHPIH